MESAVVLLSGGLNSAVAAARAAREQNVYLLFVDHGHPAAVRERAVLSAIARSVGARQLLQVDMPHVVQILDSPLGDDADRVAGQGEPRRAAASAVHPGIAPALISAAAQWAAKVNAQSVVLGTSQLCDEAEREAGPDHGAPDHRREFFHAFDILLETLRPRKLPIRIDTPLIGLTRDDIVKLGLRFNVPLEATWSCHCGGEVPCGQCVGCTSRANAFFAAGEPDPLAAVRA